MASKKTGFVGIPRESVSLFPAKTNFFDSGKKLSPLFTSFNVGRGGYFAEQTFTKKDFLRMGIEGSTTRYGYTKGSLKGYSKHWTATINGTKEWIQHIMIVERNLSIQAERFRVVAGLRALKVFQQSFSMKRFNTSNSRAWKPLAAYTIRKRAKRGTGTRILYEYGDLFKSLVLDGSVTNGGTGLIHTEVVPANTSKHKKKSICYAGWHNEGEGTYGNSYGKHTAKSYVKRQFMGHSSLLNPITDPAMSGIVKAYLFDAVFPVKMK